jgi:uncharacterized protein YdeI (YjbR/CyaY-like superfamily)
VSKPELNPKVDAFLTRAKQWQDEFAQLRRIILDAPLVEEFKWGQPCYAFDSKNVVLMHGFKEYCALLFIKGALLKDAHSVLIQQTKDVQAARQIRFTSAEQIVAMEAILKAYVLEAIEIEKSGLKVELKKTTEFEVPAEFQTQLDHMPALKSAFEALTPGRQRAYILHFSAAKQAKTREARVEKCMPQILLGKGLDD